jgi:hypothetical protein
MPEPIQSLWIGDRLSSMEQLSMRSFLAQGHPYHLYAYERIGNVPDGVVMMDAAEILPASAIFRYSEFDSVAGFANFFRYKLLLDRGGWWCDTDLVCLKPFPNDPVVFSAQINQYGTAEEPNIGAVRLPAGSEFAGRAWSVCQSKDPAKIRWGETGPDLTRQIINDLNLHWCVKSAAAFCPVPFPTWQTMLEPNHTWDFGDETYAVHLWNELWRRAGKDKDEVYDQDCLYEQLKRRYGLGPKRYWPHKLRRLFLHST